MPLLDDLLKLLGTNRTRMQWKLRAWRRAWDRRVGSAKNRAQAVTYAHQTCPRCSHPAGADERVCSRCDEPLGGVTAQRARRLFAAVWAPETPVVATLLVAINLAMYAMTLLWTHQVGLAARLPLTPDPLAIQRFGALFTPAVDDGQWWRLITGTLLHLDLMHLAMNLLSLWTVAIYLEDMLGKSKTLALYVLLGIIASGASYLWHTHTGSGIGNSAGASGAICGLIGVAIGFSVRRRNVARHMRGRYLGWAVWIAIIGLSSWHIDNAGHLGGLIPGVLLGLLVRRRTETSPRARRLWLVAALAGTVLTIVAIASAAAHPIDDELLQLVRDQRGEP